MLTSRVPRRPCFDFLHSRNWLPPPPPTVGLIRGTHTHAVLSLLAVLTGGQVTFEEFRNAPPGDLMYFVNPVDEILPVWMTMPPPACGWLVGG